MRQAGLDSLNKVWEIKAQTSFPRSDEAHRMLDRLSKAVAPLMLRRKWSVKALKEFYPKEQGLLGMNVNRGQSILIRLRPHYDAKVFYPWEHVLGTMIHELTHMEVGPHNSEFYKLMDELDEEVQRDMAGLSLPSSSSFPAFAGEGHVLGGAKRLHAELSVNSSNRQKQASLTASAAISRIQKTQLASGSGQKLGGGDRYSQFPKTPAEVRQLAAAAAERRIRDDKCCKGSGVDSQGFSGLNYSNNNNNSSTTAAGKSTGMWSCPLCDVFNEQNSSVCSFCCSPSPLIGNASAFFPAEAVDDNGEVFSLCGECLPATANERNRAINNERPIIDSDGLYVEGFGGDVGYDSRQGDIATQFMTDHEIDPFNSATQIEMDEEYNNYRPVEFVDLSDEPDCESMGVVWVCQRCTYENSGNSESCEMCRHQENVDPAGADTAIVQDSRVVVSCNRCTFENDAESTYCEACGSLIWQDSVGVSRDEFKSSEQAQFNIFKPMFN